MPKRSSTLVSLYNKAEDDSIRNQLNAAYLMPWKTPKSHQFHPHPYHSMASQAHYTNNISSAPMFYKTTDMQSFKLSVIPFKHVPGSKHVIA
jgi:hypothetical protein